MQSAHSALRRGEVVDVVKKGVVVVKKGVVVVDLTHWSLFNTDKLHEVVPYQHLAHFKLQKVYKCVLESEQDCVGNGEGEGHELNFKFFMNIKQPCLMF